MPEPTQAVDPANPTSNQELPDNNTNTDENPTPTETETIESLPEWAQKLVKGLRKENGAFRNENKSLKTADDERKRQEMSEIDRLKADHAKAESEKSALMEKVRKSQVKLVAQAKGAVDPEAVFALMDKDSVDFEDEASVEAAVEAFLAAKPYFKAAQKPNTPRTEPLSPERQAHDHLTVADLKKMTQAQIAALPKEAVDRALTRR